MKYGMCENDKIIVKNPIGNGNKLKLYPINEKLLINGESNRKLNC